MSPEDEERLRLWRAMCRSAGVVGTRFPILSYGGAKEYFEREVCFFVDTATYVGFVMLKNGGGFTPVSAGWLRDTLGMFCYLVEEESTSRVNPFVPQWLKDPSMKCINQISYVPGDSRGDVLCALAPFAGHLLSKVPKHSEDRLLQGVHRYLKTLFPRDGQREFFEAILANIVQNPGEIPRVCLVLEGRQGCGKNIFLNFFCNHVLGSEHTSQASTLSAYFNEHSALTKLKSLVIVDEVNIKEGVMYADRFKDAVTTDFVNVNEKYKPPVRYPNMATWFVTTNNRSSMVVEPGDRRFCFLDCSDKMCGPSSQEWWLEFASLLYKTEGTARAVYQYFMELDISRYRNNFYRMRPQSVTHEAAAQSGVPDFAKYLSFLCGSMEMQGAHSFTNTAMLMVNDFKEWLSAMNFSTRQQDRNTGQGFLDSMKSLCHEASMQEETKEACQYRRRANGFTFVMKANALKLFLRGSRRFHQNLYEMGGGTESMDGGTIPLDS